MSKIYMTQTGTGDNSILFLHGLWGGGNYFRDLSLVPDKFHQYYPDQLGFGKSSKPHINYTPELYSELLDAMLPKNTHVTLIGHSFGGTIALNFASLYPNRVKKIILISPLIYESKKDAIKYISTNFITKLTIEHPPIARIICNSFCSTGALGKISPFFVSKNRKGYIGGCTEHTWESYYSTFINGIINNPTAQIARKISKKIPLYIVYGDSDNYMDYDVLNTLPGTKKLIPHSDHYVLFEKSSESKIIIDQWLQSH